MFKNDQMLFTYETGKQIKFRSLQYQHLLKNE